MVCTEFLSSMSGGDHGYTYCAYTYYGYTYCGKACHGYNLLWLCSLW